MVYTVTLNPAIDKTVTIPQFTAGAVNRIQTVRTDVGGKGINVSKTLEALGVPSVAAAFLGGQTGDRCEAFLAQSAITPLIVRVPGETRTNLKIIDPVLHQNTDLNEPGPAIAPEHLSALQDAITARLRPGDLVILSGSLPSGVPADLYCRWIRGFREKGAQVFLDADGDALRFGLDAKPAAIKPNQDELSRLFGRALCTRNDLLQAGRQLLARGIGTVLISRGSGGALLLTMRGIYEACAPKVVVRSTVGAGDAMLAALACGTVKQQSAPELLRLAVAIGSASVTCEGTQVPPLPQVRQLQEMITVEEISV